MDDDMPSPQHAVYRADNLLVGKTWYWRVFGEADLTSNEPLISWFDVDHDPSRRRLPENQGCWSRNALYDRVCNTVKVLSHEETEENSDWGCSAI